MNDQQHVPNPVDLHVGARIRMRRRELGLSQETLAEAIGITFQQLQKYERGANRISASRLYALALVLKISIEWCFEGLPDPQDPDAIPNHVLQLQQAAQSLMSTPEGQGVVAHFPLIR